MSFVINLIAIPLGHIMRICYELVTDYGITIILFTLATKVIMFPLSIKVQKNSINMVKINPQLNELKMRYAGDRDRINEESLKIYEKEGYSPLIGLVPTLIQIPLIFGLIDVIYKPMKHILRISQDVISLFVAKACEIQGVETLGNSAQLQVVRMLQDPATAPLFQELSEKLPDYDRIANQLSSFKTSFLIWNLADTPSITNITSLIWIPVLSGVSAWLLCLFQNRDNVLQAEQSKASQYGLTLFMICFSVYFSFLVPAGVGFYWTVGNLLAIALIYICNWIYNPREYIDYDSMARMKAFLEKEKQKKAAGAVKKRENKKREKEYYKRFFADEKKELVFYSEKSGFYKYFKDTLEYVLLHSNITIHYVTSDPDDALFQQEQERLIPYYIGDTKLITLFMKMDAKMMVMTTPDLEQLHLKRSLVKKNVEYIYMPHYPLAETMTGRKGSIDYFDTIFCVSKYQMREIRELEEHYQTKKKRLVETGYSFIENLQAMYDSMEKTKRAQPKVLIAPSWQEDNILDSCLHSILKQLLRKGFEVVVRPHPEYVKRYGIRMEQIVERYSGYNGGDLFFELDFSKSNSLYDSDLLITDWSGAAYEFAFVTKKPVVFINTPPKIVNPEYTVLSEPPMEFVLRDKLGMQVDMDQLNSLYEGVKRILAHSKEYQEAIRELVAEHISHFGQAGEIGGQYIIDRLRPKKKKQTAKKEQI